MDRYDPLVRAYTHCSKGVTKDSIKAVDNTVKVDMFTATHYYSFCAFCVSSFHPHSLCLHLSHSHPLGVSQV